jgi:hypothetical protein
MTYSEIVPVTSLNGVLFNIWGRDSTVHFDLSVECDNPADVTTPDGQKYHGHLEHPEGVDTCMARIIEIKAIIEAGVLLA